MIVQPVALKRCASCQRWGGSRQVGGEPETVEIQHEGVVGPCQGGPWDGTERRIRNACGRWTRWLVLATPSDQMLAPGLL